MLVSLNWLKQYVTIDAAPQQIADALTMAGLEVEGVSNPYAHLENVVVGEIQALRPVEGSDHLNACRVDVGGKVLDVVCGAPNAREGMKAPVALPGARLPDGSVIQAGRIRGAQSQGMLCSEAELGLGEDGSGIMALSQDLANGRPLTQALGLSDTVLELSITPNRPDCLSILGVARELAAIFNTKVHYPDASLAENGPPVESLTSVVIESPDHCPRYAARVITGIAIGPSPAWLANSLLAVGVRPINNIVDVTNYVMMETGQPLHAFDFDLLEEKRIVVRTARKGEPFTTLDNKENVLEDDMLMICDGKKPVALAGVMGGLNSEIGDGTTSVLIESAHFSPMSIRKTAKRLGYHTEASHRFERGADHDGVVFAAQRAARLMLEVAGGVSAKGCVDAHPVTISPKEIALSTKKANIILGTSLSQKEIAGLLESVGMKVRIEDEDLMTASAPVYRVDVSRPEDLVEEVARLHGYEKIPTTWPVSSMETRAPNPLRDFVLGLRTSLCGLGFLEAITYSFVGANTPDKLELAENDPRRLTLPVLNPLSEDQAVMRTSLLPGLFGAAAVNINQQSRNLSLFETGKTFIAHKGQELPTETESLALLITGAANPASWHGKAEPADFFDLKGCCEALFEDLHIPQAAFEKLDPSLAPYMAPGHCASILSRGQRVGWAGKVRPDVLKKFDIKQDVFVAELDVQSLFEALPGRLTYQAPPRFPATDRDITLIIDKNVEADQVLDAVRQKDQPWVRSVDVVAVYEGKPVPSGKKSLSFRITYRADEGTLQDKDVNEVHEQIGREILSAFSAGLPEG